MSIQFSPICDPRLIDAVEHVAGALMEIASAIEHHTDKAFPSLPEKALNLARWSELKKMLDIQIEENERRDQFAQETRAVIESETLKRAAQIIIKKDLRCRDCTHCKHKTGCSDFSFFCEKTKHTTWTSYPACLEIDPTQETIDTMGEIKINTDGEVIA